jgi:hypothetical protein
MSPSPPLRGHININQETREFQRALLEMGDQFSAPTPASGGMGAVPGGTFILNGAAISWKSKKQPYMSPAANIDKKCETAQGAEVKTGHGAAVKTGYGAAVKTGHSAAVKTGYGAAVKTANGARAEEKTADGAAVGEAGTPSAKVPARTAARSPRDFLQVGSQQTFQNINVNKTATGAEPGLTAG